MTVYLVLMLFCAALGLFLCEKGSKKTEYGCVLAIAFSLCLLAVIRSGKVGVDFDWIYRDYFLAVNDNLRFDYIFSAANPYRREFLFTLLNIAIALFTDEPLVLWGIAGALITALQSAFFMRYSKKPWLCLYLYIALGFFGYSLCYIRQMLAVSVAFFALPFLEERKPIPFFAIIMASGFIHNSLFLLLPLYFLAKLPLNKITAAIYTLGFGIMVIFSDSVLRVLVRNVPHFSIYLENSYIFYGRSFRHAFLWLVLLTLSLLCYPRLSSRDKTKLPLFNLCLFGTLTIMLIIKSEMYQRVSLTLLPFFTLLIPELVCALKPADGIKKSQYENENRFYYTIMVLFMVLATFQFFFSYSVDTLGIFPYSPFWR